jgi:multicomponent Na+:H+ antiporter subunit D
MNWNEVLPWLILSSSLITGLAIFFLPEGRHGLRSALNLTGALAKLALIAIMLWGVFNEQHYETRYALLPGIDFVLRADALAMLFVVLSAVLWLFTTIYAIGYLEGSPHRSRFFGFFSLCVTSTMGIAFAGNLFTFFLFYELLTLSTYPLVVHRGTDKALRAGNVYLGYTLAGGAVLLIGVIWLYSLLGNVEFAHGGVLSVLAAEHHGELIAIFALLIAGLGVKAALVPLHGWLPVAMVAPAPVSALLHAVAVVKAGAFGIVRVVYDVYGIEFAQDLGLLLPLAVIASITIVYGSLRALAQDDLKRRLAFSTVSQVSYIALGVGLFGPIGTIGGLAHLVHQGIMKITLFFCAGNLAETLGIHKVSEMRGVGRRMPWTMAAFTVAAFGMIGVPPLAGFISKWYLGLGALDAQMPWVLAVLAASSALNAAYFLPILYSAWFRPQRGRWPAEQPRGRLETGWRLLLPPLVTAVFTLAAGLFAATLFSPLEWAQLIMAREYVR